MQNVNDQLKAKGYGELKEGNTVTGMSIENLILDEQSRSDALVSFKTLIDNGVMNTQESARTIKRELEHEVHGGFGITRTSKVDDIMMLVPNRETRVELENQFVQDAKHKGLQPNEGSIVRAYLAADGWEPDDVDRFDANWVKNNSYSHEQDQDHRNGVIGRLAFEHNIDNDNENLKAALGAVDTNSDDYTYLSEKAAEANNKAGYVQQFKGQDPVQQYIAGKTSDNGVVDAGEVSACNTLMYKGIKPINIQAEEALYEAKNGDLSHVFDSMDPKLYEEINTMLTNGEIQGCKSLKDVYNQAMAKTTDSGEKARLQANAILSGQVEFSDKEITDFCVQLMHRIDIDRGNGASSHISAANTNNADYETVQLKAILQANPQVIKNLKEKVQNGEFKYTVSIDNGDYTQFLERDTKADYLQILADTKTVAKEAVFLDDNGNKITDAQTVKRLQNANMKSLDAMRKYVAQLEREYKLGTDAEGDLSDAANALSRYSGMGTDRGDVETKYREAKVLLDQLEAAAQGKLRDADGNVISAQDLAQQLVDKEKELIQTNNDYKSTIQTGKMAIVMAPVIAATTVASGGLSLAAGAATGTTATVLGSSWTAATVAGVTAGATTYGMNAIEYNTSHTGNTVAARENNLNESLINGGTVFIGAAQMKYIPGLFNNTNAFVRGGGRLTTVLGSDIGVGAAGEYVQTGQVSVNGIAMNAVFSATGNLIGLKSLSKKQKPISGMPKIEVDVSQNVSTPVLDKASSNGHAHSSDVIVGQKKAAQIQEEVRQIASDPNATPEELARVKKEAGAIANRDVRRAAEADINNAANGLSDDARLAFERLDYDNLKQNVDHIFDRHNELHSTDVRNINDFIGRTDDIEVLQDLKSKLFTKEHTYGGVTKDYKGLYSAIDNKIADLTPKTVKTNAQIKEDVSSMLANKGASGKGLNVDDVNLVKQYISTIQDEAQLKELMSQMQGKKMTSAHKKEIKEALQLKSKELKNGSLPLSVADDAQKTPKYNGDVEVLYVEKPVVLPEMPKVVKSPYGDFKPVTSRQDADDVFKKMVTDRLINVDDPQRGMLFMDARREYWLESLHSIEQGTRWKIHLYANSPEEWANVAQVALPYLEKNKSLAFKTVRNFGKLEDLRYSVDFGDGQTGKAFTVYFEDEQAFLKAADDLGTLFDNSGMHSSGMVKNEAQIGESGFVSYRNELENRASANYKPEGMEDPYLKYLREK